MFIGDFVFDVDRERLRGIASATLVRVRRIAGTRIASRHAGPVIPPRTRGDSPRGNGNCTIQTAYTATKGFRGLVRGPTVFARATGSAAPGPSGPRRSRSGPAPRWDRPVPAGSASVMPGSPAYF